ncbi:hypothetical protein [Vibrio sp. TRT 17S01]|uniref:hypothetical protein n=1 Tax=Vibrio sp. TRT 17S01 TaxID=3418505 RepID=UPI003CF9BE9A
MSKLASAFEQVGIQQLEVISQHQKHWVAFCDENEALFNKVIENKPETPIHHHLLGILTKAHIESQSAFEHNQASTQAMQQVFEQNLGHEHARRFENHGYNQLLLITHAWLYMQGYLRMDFSLANDHAHQTATLMTSISKLDSEHIRTQFLSSFYTGANASPLAPKKGGLLAAIKAYFKW